MKHFLTVLLCLLLSGCAPGQQAVPEQTAPQALTEAVSVGMYDPDHPMETRYPGQIRSYPLTQGNVHGLLTIGEDVLILSGQDSTTLTLLSGYDLHLTAARTLGFSLEQNDPSVQIHDGSISYFDPRHCETVVLDHRLQEIRRIAVPREITGKPILSADTKTLFYCTPWAVVAWNLESGIRRTVKEIQYSHQELTALLREDQVLACRLSDGEQVKTVLLSADNGMELRTLPEDAELYAGKGRYFLSMQDGFQQLMIFSREDSAPELLLPENPPDAVCYLDENYAAVTVRASDNCTVLDYYDLETGILSASVTLDSLQPPKSIVADADHAVYILVCDPATDGVTVYRWEIPENTAEGSDADSHTFAYRGKEDPDQEALEQCRQYARSIGQKYGVSIQVWEDSCRVQPWDYQFAPEYLAPVLQKELQLLDQRLARYPAEVLEKTAAHFSGITICLVRNISGSTDTGSLASPTGIQFFQDNQAYVVITTGKHSEQALYHELYHVMETHILTKSSALDHWESLNPVGFSYGQEVSAEAYLQGQTRAFVDSYSMVSLKEDRARTLENAMLAGRKELFRSEYLQRKLTALCQSIRESYGLKKTEEILPWEQYLVTPLAPSP